MESLVKIPEEPDVHVHGGRRPLLDLQQRHARVQVLHPAGDSDQGGKASGRRCRRCERHRHQKSQVERTQVCAFVQPEPSKTLILHSFEFPS